MAGLLVTAADSGGNFLVSPSVGLMIWTLLAFFVTYLLLRKLAFPRIQEALQRRQKAIDDSIDAAERTRREAEELLGEYRERLREARKQADDIMERARRAGEQQERETVQDGRKRRAATSRSRPSARSRSCARRSPTSRCWPPRRSPARRSTTPTSGASSMRRS